MGPHSLKIQGSHSQLHRWPLREPRQTGVGEWLVGFDQQLLKRHQKEKKPKKLVSFKTINFINLKAKQKCVCVPPTLMIKESVFCYELTIVL